MLAIHRNSRQRIIRRAIADYRSETYALRFPQAALFPGQGWAERDSAGHSAGATAALLQLERRGMHDLAAALLQEARLRDFLATNEAHGLTADAFLDRLSVLADRIEAAVLLDELR